MISINETEGITPDTNPEKFTSYYIVKTSQRYWGGDKSLKEALKKAHLGKGSAQNIKLTIHQFDVLVDKPESLPYVDAEGGINYYAYQNKKEIFAGTLKQYREIP